MVRPGSNHMRWKKMTPKQRRDMLNEWHPRFAWWPRRDTEHGYVMWLERILRKSRDKDGMAPWRYRPITILETDVRPNATASEERTLSEAEKKYLRLTGAYAPNKS